MIDPGNEISGNNPQLNSSRRAVCLACTEFEGDLYGESWRAQCARRREKCEEDYTDYFKLQGLPRAHMKYKSKPRK